MDQQRCAGQGLGAGRRSQRLSLIVGEGPGAAHLPDDPRLDTGVPHPLQHIPHNLFDYVVFGFAVHIPGMKGADIVAGTHNYIKTGGTRDPGQSERVPLDADAGGINQGTSTGPFIPEGLVDGGLFVQQGEVVPAAGPVVAHPPQVLEGHRLAGEAHLAGLLRLLEHATQVYEQMLVGVGYTQGLGTYRPQHRLRLARKLGSNHGLRDVRLVSDGGPVAAPYQRFACSRA